MKAVKSKLHGGWILEPKVFRDSRGYFYEAFNHEQFKNITGIAFKVKQINSSTSSRGVLRGLHFQKLPMAQSKLISCTKGEILDVAVDLRKNSPTYLQHEAVVLSNANKKQFFIPKGMAHGFLTLSSSASLTYLVDELYSSEHDDGILFCDQMIGIDWKFSPNELVLSAKDRNLPTFKEAKINF